MYLQYNCRGKTFPIEVMPVANCNDDNRSQYLQPLVRSVRESLVSNLTKCHITEYCYLLSTVLNSHDPPTFE